jgi:hypothetical protein
MTTLREKVEAIAKEWEAEAARRDRAAMRFKRDMRVSLQTGASFERNHAAALRALLASPEATDPDARVKKGFRIGINAAAKAIDSALDDPDLLNDPAAVIAPGDLVERVLALAPSIATRLGPHCTEGDEETLKAVNGALKENTR